MNLLEPGIPLILFLQSLGEWLVGPMRFFTFLGNEEFFLLVAPALYWCVDTRLGARIGLYLMTSVGLNETFKLVFHLPRPYWLDPAVRALSIESSFGLPSGHSQTAMAVWGRAAAWIGRAWAWAAGIAIVLLIGLSRMALGVHFPADVLVGWLIGALLLAVLLRLEAPVAAWAGARPAWLVILAALAVSLLCIAAAASARQALTGWELPAEWVENARRADPNGEPIQPITLSGAITGAAGFFGMSAGLVLNRKAGGLKPPARGGSRCCVIYWDWRDL